MSGKRSIFEEVGRPASRAGRRPRPARIDRGRGGARRGIRAWLIVLFVLVVAMIVVGGLTRLTDCGLSITEWRPLTGALPPMSEADWQAEFDKYQQIDEFQMQNQWMELDDFKRDLLVGMGPPAAGPGDRAGLGAWASSASWLARQIPDRLDRAAAAARRRWAGCRARSAGGWWPRA